ncbi:uncharacterized protein LOC105837692 [Monomorium pharaonis]|uniref:uncharacterized protein LOC105837692 n=1 Tax=Monomorium pharaonis TaxID=307658 RepID=UPI00063F0E54|nr:uncharacterized protein LOC105837692 [Monomorium pharaonis]
MANKRIQAISIANRYFILADGMIPGLKDHLAEQVVLKWFGQVIKGRENVANFILFNKMKVFHMFSDIMPISGISCGNKQSKRKIKRSIDQNGKCETYTNNYLREAPGSSSHETEMSTTHENGKDYDQMSNSNDAAIMHEANECEHEFDLLEKNILDKLKVLMNEDDEKNVAIDVNQDEFIANATAENDLYNLFEPKIMSQHIVEKIQNINRIKLKEEMAPTIRVINRECGQGDGPVTAEANATKYLKANGEIQFVRMAAQTDSLSLYHRAKLGKKKFWKQQCILQIAYSLTDNSPIVAKKCYDSQESAYSAQVSNLSAKVHHDADKVQKSKLLSLEEAIRASNTLIRDVNNFGGYLQPLNFSEDRDNFLKTFQAEIKDRNVHFCANYVNNKLIFDCPNRRPFKAICQIHEIVYTTVRELHSQGNACNTEETAQVKNKTITQVAAE